MAFIGELLTYLFKFIILGGVTIAAVLCGAKYKKSKIAKAAAEADNTESDITE
ncbi:MAG: hypothetical protein J6C01_07325 [Lachnospiraceae bacterium]|nr:hypothetical protein [Lachnospiraceae bacterium]